MGEGRDFVSVHRFAKMLCVSVKTARRWIDEESAIFAGQIMRQNKTLYIGSGAINELLSAYTVDYEEASI